MAAQLPDFEYDIFISYRQKDNENTISEQGTGWMTQFVSNLRKELAAGYNNFLNFRTKPF